MKVGSYVFTQVLTWTATGAILILVFIDWSKVTWFDLLVAVGFVFGLLNYLYFLFSNTLYGKEISRQNLSLDLPAKQTIAFSLVGFRGAKFLVFSPQTNLIDLTGSISLIDGEGKIVKRLLINKKPSGEADILQASKTTRISSGGKAAANYQLQGWTLEKVNPLFPTAEMQFELDWSSTERTIMTKPLNIEVILRARKEMSEVSTGQTEVMLN